MPPEEQQPTVAEERTGGLIEISNAMVRLYKDQFGRGPTSARSYWAGPDVIMCLLEDTLTPAERNLVTMGEHKLVRDTRMVFQYAEIRGFCEPVERISGRTVRAFHSSIDTHVDGMSTEVFVLYSKGETGPSRMELGGH
jgi:uncharacterized protein YbcI